MSIKTFIKDSWSYAKKNYKGIFLIVIIFTFLDFLLHVLSPLLLIDLVFPPHMALPSYYYIGKVLGSISLIPMALGAIPLPFKINLLLISIALQIRYFFTAYYPIQMTIFMVLIHYFLLNAAFWIEERRLKNA